MSDLYHSGVNPLDYETFLNQKHQNLRQTLSSFAIPDTEVFVSEPSHYRLRAEFRIWHSGDRCFYAMFDPADRKKPLEVLDFPVASVLINQLMKRVLDKIHESDLLKHRLFQVEFLTTLSGDALITLIYHKKLDEEWEAAARSLMAELGYPIIGRSRKQKLVLERDWVNETLTVDGQLYHYRQIEGGFTQPNGAINEKMLSWARDCSTGIGGDLLELYCGNGNFSVALANRFERVLATEISKTSVAAAQVNIQSNQLS
ncbi:MAG: tRNA (uridine(54)-C5)-methyltransferase TrmA, partial [Oceanobacter sp.]